MEKRDSTPDEDPPVLKRIPLSPVDSKQKLCYVPSCMEKRGVDEVVIPRKPHLSL